MFIYDGNEDLTVKIMSLQRLNVFQSQDKPQTFAPLDRNKKPILLRKKGELSH